MTTLQKIQEIELEMSRTQKNKATSGHLGLLKAKLAKLKREMMEGPKGAGGGGAGEGALSFVLKTINALFAGFDVTKSGDCRV